MERQMSHQELNSVHVAYIHKAEDLGGEGWWCSGGRIIWMYYVMRLLRLLIM